MDELAYFLDKVGIIMKLGKKIFLMSLSVGLILIMILGMYSIANLVYLRWSLSNTQSQSRENISKGVTSNSGESVNGHARLVYDDKSNQMNNKFSKIFSEINVIAASLSDLYNKSSYIDSGYIDDDISLQPGVSKNDVYDEYNKIKNIKLFIFGGLKKWQMSLN